MATTLHRRAVVAGGLAALAGVVAPAPADAEQIDPIFAAIEDCHRKEVAWKAAFEGPDPAPNERELGKANEAALQALARTSPTTSAGAGALLAYIHSVEFDYITSVEEDGSSPYWAAVKTVIAFLSAKA